MVGLRGSGKTRAGAEYLHHRMVSDPAMRAVVVDLDYGHFCEDILMGNSGLFRIADPADRPRFIPSMGRIEWPAGGRAWFSAPDSHIVGHRNESLIWGVDADRWDAGSRAWDAIEFQVRQGTAQVVLTVHGTQETISSRVIQLSELPGFHLVSMAGSRAVTEAIPGVV
jgi:phage terminase large subunit-like protein